MRRRAKHQKHTVKLRHLIYLALVTTVISSTTLARFALKENVGAQATIAAFVSEANLRLDIGELSAMAPGESTEISFNVTNKKGATISEVPVNYEMQFETTGNLPLEFALSLDRITGEDDEALSKPVGGLDQDLCAKGGRLPSAVGGKGEATTHWYKLKITWPEGKNAEEYSQEIDHLSVNIKTEQAGKDD